MGWYKVDVIQLLQQEITSFALDHRLYTAEIKLYKIQFSVKEQLDSNLSRNYKTQYLAKRM